VTKVCFFLETMSRGPADPEVGALSTCLVLYSDIAFIPRPGDKVMLPGPVDDGVVDDVWFRVFDCGTSEVVVYLQSQYVSTDDALKEDEVVLRNHGWVTP